MRIVCIGGGPGGLYAATLIKKRLPGARVSVVERNRPDDTFGFGVVFSDATLSRLERADPESHAAILRSFVHWTDIDIRTKAGSTRSTGHGFSGLSRRALLAILQGRAREVGVELEFEREASIEDPDVAGADLVVVADGVFSRIRDARARAFGPTLDLRKNRFVWLGTTFPFEAFTFAFREAQAGLFALHAYRYEPGLSTFIVECSEETLARTGLVAGEGEDEAKTASYLEEVFARDLGGHRLLVNKSIWRSFPVVRAARWHDERMVLLGDAAHTAHFSIGSGTKLAMEDAIALAESVGRFERLGDALSAYEAERRPVVESLQRAAQVSLEWFEGMDRYASLPPLPFALSLLTRSLRVSHQNLLRRDPELVARADRDFAEEAALRAEIQVEVPAPSTAVPASAPPVSFAGPPRGRPPEGAIPPPMLTPFRLRELLLENRIVVSPMCQYLAEDGLVGDWHLAHLGSRAQGGAGLVMTEMTDVSAEGRITPGCAGLYAPTHEAAWRRIVDFVHRYTRAKIGIQLGHAGRKGSTRVPWEGGAPLPEGEGAWTTLAPSALPYFPRGPAPRAMDRADMEKVRAEFVHAAGMAASAGFDLLELHMAHGYLLASFLSPLTNGRTDAYGGSIEDRARFPLEVFRAVRAAWPAERPMSVRISATDWAPGGLEAEDAVAFARMLARAGCDLVDVSTGQTVPTERPAYGRLYQVPFADRIRHEAGVPTMTVGGISSFADANGVLLSRRADLVALARAHLHDPYWTRHAAEKQGFPLPWPPPYASLTRFTPRQG